MKWKEPPNLILRIRPQDYTQDNRMRNRNNG